MDEQYKRRILAAHLPDGQGRVQWLLCLALLVTCEVGVIWSVKGGPGWLAVPLVLALAHLMHGQLMAFHEAAHRTLALTPWRNDVAGILLGTFSFMGLTAYRAAHRTHHAHLATERDEELWPFVVPGFPRALRLTALFVQLFLGLGFLPSLTLRTFLRSGSPMKSKAERRRTAAEYAIMAIVWMGILAAVVWTSEWKLFLLAYVAPAVLAGNIQGFRLAVEHMGLTGRTKLASTRSVVPTGAAGRLLAFTWLNIEYHGAHHRFGGIPQTRLPDEKWLLDPTGPDERGPYPSYRSAFRHMLRSLPDPRIGAQWLRATAGS
jgi:fatty acid desaturase